jgi:thiamine monophosphate kinase
LEQSAIPLSPGAGLEDALYGGDDYQILCTADVDLPGFTCIGEIVADAGTWMAGVKLQPRGYNHFGAAS